MSHSFIQFAGWDTLLNKMNIKVPNTLSFRLSLWYMVAFVFLLVTTFSLTFIILEISFNNEINDDLEQDIGEYRKLFIAEGIDSVIGEINRDVKPEDSNDEFILIKDKNSQKIFSSDMSRWGDTGFSEEAIKYFNNMELSPNIYYETLEITPDNENARVASAFLGSDLFIQIGESLEPSNDLLDLLLYIFVAVFFAVISLAYLLGWFVSRHAVRSIKEVSLAAADIRNGNLDSRVEVTGQRDEIQDLADTFNSMAEKIKELITEMREMIDNIAHDLRSPLGRIRMISEVTLSNNKDEDCRTSASTILEQCDNLLQYINSILDVAEAESGVFLVQNEQVNLTSITENACELFETVADAKNIKFSESLVHDCVLSGNKQSLQRMIANVLDNAMKYTPEKGQVSVNLCRDNEKINLIISDSGIGISDSEQTRVFERFFRSDQSRSEEGCGLGLSFALAVARAHGGDIELASEHGKGSTFSIILPFTA